MLDAIIPGFIPKTRGVLHEIRQNQGLSAIIPGYCPEIRGLLHEGSSWLGPLRNKSPFSVKNRSCFQGQKKRMLQGCI
jgi:hypothetical protein